MQTDKMMSYLEYAFLAFPEVDSVKMNFRFAEVIICVIHLGQPPKKDESIWHER